MMVQPASIAKILPALAGRPPTPPRDSDNSAESKSSLFSRIFAKGSLASQTQDTTPTSSSESHAQGEPFKKKVAWDDDKTSSVVQAVSAHRKPIKSILKPYNGSTIHINLGSNSKLSPPHTYANLAAMLESVAKQLAGNDRSSKMDAYTTLSGVLKASENVPDVRALKDKMGLLLQFIRRDLTVKSSTGTLDTTLVVNALSLLAIFLRRPAIAENITAEFIVYLIDHAIKAFEDVTMSKDIVKHLMLVLAEQTFSTKIMNAERVSRLISALHNIEKHVKGKSIVVGRINIYRRLLRQSRTHILANTVWIEDVFGDMFSSVKDTRASAITFGLEAGLVLGTEIKATRAFMELFASDFDLDVGDPTIKFGDYYAGRLKAMAESKQEVASVPQIWSVPILFLRSRPRQFEQWAFMNTWLAIIQACFNCSDYQAKFEANLAWNRLVFAIRPDEKTAPRIINMLNQPLREQLRRRGRGRKAALGSLCNLLYYSLKPSATYTQLDLYWDRYIVDSVGKTLAPKSSPSSTPDSTRQDSRDACHILTALFDSTTPRPWKENRATDSCSGKDTSMETSELPALDSKWLRKSASRVFTILSPLLEKLYWDLGGEDEGITALWKAYITSIASPAVMEVKVSNETMSCVAYVFGLLYSIWQRGPGGLECVSTPEEPLSEGFLSSFERLVTTTIKGLGPLPFTEKLLSIGSEDEFVVIATPSHQPRKARGEPKCPLHHLVVLLTHVSPDLEYDRKFSQMLHLLLSPFFDARPSKRVKLELIQDLLKLLPLDSNAPSRMIWSVLADFATFATDTRDEVGNGTSVLVDQPLGADYRSTLKILEQGVDLSPAEPLPGWNTLFEALVTSATIDAGDGGRALAVIEPLGRVLQLRLSKTDLHPTNFGFFYFRTLLSKATYPKDRLALDAARRRLWGSGVAKTSSFDPYSLLYEYIRETLQKTYKSFSSSLYLEYSDMIAATTALLTHCPTSLLINLLVKLQNGIAMWIKDEGACLGGGSTLSHSITSLWARISHLVPVLARSSNPSKLLANLEVLICSGLESRHRTIANASIRVWNTTFGTCKEHFVYPNKVKNALLNLRTVAELQLPFFPESLESDGVIDQRQPPAFADSQVNRIDIFASTGIDSVVRAQNTPQLGISPGISPRSSSRLRDYTPQVIIEIAQSVPLKRSRESTPDPKHRKSRKHSDAPKLRHDDSQIQFEAIVSSPVADAVLDSQLLTDRQKEVKERQEAEAAMFPDLRSSPRNRVDARSDPELPLHRASSKSRAIASPVAERQTTPILVPYAEEDDYVNSSPTPTRAQQEGNLLDVPSSPLKATHGQPAAHILDETNIPSSPPDITYENEIDTMASFDPSAQIDPYAVENIPTLSTLESTQGQRNGPATLEFAVPAESSKIGSTASETEAEMAIERPTTNSEPKEVEEAANVAPGTPNRGRESSPTPFQTPRSEVYHDTQTSPASSDKNTVNEDVFLDAVSSPRLNADKANKQQASSELSYLDESSALRLMEGYDQGSGRPRRSVKFSSGQEKQSLPASPSPPKALSKPTIKNALFHSVMTVSHSMAESLETAEVDTDIQQSLPVGESESSTATPSLIPETPALKSKKNLLVVDGEEIDLDETIVVDHSVLEERDALVPARRGKKRKSDTHIARSPAKKGKQEAVAAELSEDNGTSAPNSEVFSPKKKASPQKRKLARHGPPKRSSRLSSLSQTGVQGSPVQTFSTADHESSIQDSQEIETTTAELVLSSDSKEVIVSGTNEVVVEDSFEAPRAQKELLTSFNEDSKAIVVQDEEEKGDGASGNTIDSRIDDEDTTSELEIVADTVIGESSSLDNAGAVPNTLEEEVNIEAVISTSKIIAWSSEPVAQVQSAQADASMQTEVVEAAPSVQGLKDKLQSILGVLRNVALSRNEMNELEDLFVDVKEQLYGAGRRGRTAF